MSNTTDFVWIAKLSDEQLARLVELAREHSRLAAEHGRRGTTADRQADIKARIAKLEAERERILEA